MNNYSKLSIKLILSCLSVAIIYGCSTQKDNATNRSLQNLSARYNLIYNSNVLLTAYQEDLSLTYKDNYDQFLPIYIAPATIDNLADAPAANSKGLDEINTKARLVIGEKNFSNYIDEAYMLLGKTNFYKSDYFTAVAYFDYTSRTYNNNHKIYLDAMNWKARSLMQLRDYQRASIILDTVKMELDSVKNGKAEPLATLAQMSVYQNQFKQAITYLEQALKENNQTRNKIRWSYILGQLYEYEKDYPQSLRYYTKVEKSNAAFETYFNAKLSKIRINDLLDHKKTNRKQQLLTLLKDDKNVDFIDQIYYEVAEDFYIAGDYAKSSAYYKLSAQKSSKNQYQKGLSYLKVADLNFRDLGDYVNAKLYYDSAIAVLPKNYPNYEAIARKAQNLEYLTQRYESIRLEDQLQKIALLPEGQRADSLNVFFTPAPVSTSSEIIDNGSFQYGTNTNNTKVETNGTFYFNNSTAISRGFSDFRKKWGNRKLANNWRQSVKSSAQTNQQAQAMANDNAGLPPSNPDQVLPQVKSGTDQAKSYLDSLPLTAERLQLSNQKIINSYFEVASFYQQVLNDKPEAIKTYQILLGRFPENKYLDAINYSLYLNYRDVDKSKSEFYKNLILTRFPNSLYAKTIADPNFSLKQNSLEAAVQRDYSDVFTSYEQKKFDAVIKGADAANQRFPGNNLESQFAYLKALGIGRTQNVDSLIFAFDKLVAKYPSDKIIKPLVENHLLYINAHMAEFRKRRIALPDFDPNEPPFIVQQTIVEKPVVNNPVTPIAQPVETKPVVEEPKAPTVTPPIVATLPPATTGETPKDVEIQKPVKKDELFSIAPSTTYYFVVDVADNSVSVSSSRFGIGQYNRGNYTGDNLRHQLKELDEDQLIYVGNFSNFNEAKAYEEGIKKELGNIMKVPAAKYVSFVISKENFEKLSNKETINRYLVFIKE